MNGAALDLPRALPEVPEAEQAVLGAILLDNSAVAAAHELVAVSDFSFKHQRIFRAMLELDEGGNVIDQVTLSEHLREKGELDNIGGASYLAELINLTPSAANIKSHCKVVRDAAEKRRLIGEIHAISDSAYSGQTSQTCGIALQLSPSERRRSEWHFRRVHGGWEKPFSS